MILEISTIGIQETFALSRVAAYRRELQLELAQSERWVGPVRRLLDAEAIQRSTGIGGYNVLLEDALAAVESDRPIALNAFIEGPPAFTSEILRNWNAVMAYRRAMAYVLQLQRDDDFDYTSAVLKALHFMMTEYSLESRPGLWRTGPVWIKDRATDKTVYEGPPAEDVPALVDELMTYLWAEHEKAMRIRTMRKAQLGDPLIPAAMAHLNLAMIHPFKDGNGRMSRALQTLVLAREGILEPQWCSIEEYLGDNTDAYFRVLAKVGKGRWSPQSEPLPWIRFCLQAHYVQGARVLRRVRESRLVWGRLEAICKRASLPERCAFALFDASAGLRVSNASYRNLLRFEDEDIPRQAASRDLHAMVEHGLLKRQGNSRNSYYNPGRPLLAIRESVIADRKPMDPKQAFAEVA